MPSGKVRTTGPFNIEEIFKFLRMSVIWLGIIFGAVWIASWAVGLLVPKLFIFPVLQHPANADQQLAAGMTMQALMWLVPLVAVMVFIPINAMFMVLAERRALALFTVRKGPNRVGILGFNFDGFFQTAADAVKLLFKEDITPQGADAFMFTLAPIIFFAPSIFGALPLLAAATNNNPLFAATNLSTGIFYVLAMSSIPVIALVMGGWASNNKYSLVGGLRSAAQAVAYEIPLVLAIITICYLSGTLDVVKIGSMQSYRDPQELSIAMSIQSLAPQQVFLVNPDDVPTSPGLLRWNLFGKGVLALLAQFSEHPDQAISAVALVVCCFLLFGLYMTGACAEINRIPFDLPEAESELVSGYNTEYSGIKFAIFFLAEFTNLFIVSTIATVMFLGAGASPIPGFLDAHFFQQYICSPIAHLILGPSFDVTLPPGDPKVNILWFAGSLFNPVTASAAFWVIAKVYALVFFAILVRGTLPRFRIDQLMDFGWKRLIPLSLILFLAVAFIGR
jgi:NADH-quinone oxidoreductase subunit H